MRAAWPARRCVHAFLLALAAAALAVPGCHGTMFDPCAPLTPVARGDGFPIGLVLIPGGNATTILNMLQSTDVGTDKLCNKTFTDALETNFTAQVAVYNLKVDRMHVMRLPYPDIIFRIINLPVGANATYVAIAFRNNVYSAPAYLFNGTPDPSIHGAGFVVSLALLLNFDKGVLQRLQWYDLTCNDCGGKSSQVCVQQIGVNSCATPFVNCTCINVTMSDGSNCSYADSMFDKCSTAINTGFTGTDRYDTAFRTGPQIQRLNAYSLVSLFYQAKDAVMSQFNGVYYDISAQWNQAAQDAKAQQVDFESGVGTSTNKATGPSTPAASPSPSPAPANGTANSTNATAPPTLPLAASFTDPEASAYDAGAADPSTELSS